MVQQYNKQLSSQARFQSLLGEQRELGSIKADRLIMATVIKVNYLYNTVDVMSIRNHEMLMKGEDSKGQFSARMPVTFGGSYENGLSYGETIPINVGDQVLIGFMENSTDAPIVINVYKTDGVAYELASTNQVSGNPDADERNRKKTMEYFKLFPSQTYDWVDGEGTRESTFQGRSFFKTAVGLFGSARLNDYGYNYEDLERIHLRGRDLEPVSPELSQILFQHNATFAKSKTNVLFDDDSSFSISKINNDANDSSRSEIRLENAETARLRVQSDSKKYKKDASYTEAGANLSEAYLEAGSHKLSLDKDGNLTLDGSPISGGGISDDDLNKIKQLINNVQKELDDFKDGFGGITGGNIQDLITEVDDLQKQAELITASNEDIKNQYTEIYSQYQSLVSKVGTNETAISNLTLLVNNAAGTDKSLQDRLDRMEKQANEAKVIVDEMVNARKDNYTGATYDKLGSRLDKMSEDLQNVIKATADINTIREQVSNIAKTQDSMQKLLETLYDQVQLLTGGENEITTTFLVTINTDDATVIKQGSGAEVHLGVRVLRNGLDITGVITSDDVSWTRISGDVNGDAVWNANHSDHSRTLTVSEKDLIGNARFRATLPKKVEAGDTVIYGEIQITVDMDLPSVNMLIKSDTETRQVYNSTSKLYSPDLTAKPINLQLMAFLPGTTTDVSPNLSHTTWSYVVGGTIKDIDHNTPGFTLSGNADGMLKVATNVPVGNNYMRINAYANYTDPVSNKTVLVRSSTDVELVNTADSGMTLDVYTTTGEIILDNVPSKVMYFGDIYVNGLKSSGSRIYELFAQDPTVTDTSNEGYHADGGLGWRKITSKSAGYTLSVDFGVTTTTPINIQVGPEAVINIQTLKLLVKSDGKTDIRYNTIRNMDSPMSLVINSKTGFLLGPTVSQTTLTATLFSNGKEVDTDGSKYVYRWYAYDDNSALISNFGGAGQDFRLGKQLTIARDEFSGNAITLNLEVGDS